MLKSLILQRPGNPPVAKKHLEHGCRLKMIQTSLQHDLILFIYLWIFGQVEMIQR